MIRTIVALSDSAMAQNIIQVLSHRGINVRYRCQNGAEVIRAVREMGGGVVICPFKLRDMTAEDLADRLDGKGLLLVLGKGSTLQYVEREDIFTMATPMRISEFIGAVNMLLQMDAMRAARTIPKRSKEAQQAIDDAKALLMADQHMTEPEAHRYLQQCSMKASMRMEEMARVILESAYTNE